MRVKLTKIIVEKIEPGQIIWDTAVSGFGVRRQKKAISYIVKGRLNGRQKLVTIGKHGAPWTVSEARKKAREILLLFDQGTDPNEEKRRKRAKQTVDAIWKEFDAAHISKLKKRTQEEYRRLYRLHIRPAIGWKRLADVTRQEISALHRKLKDTPRAANFCLAVISKFMNWAEDMGYRERNSNPVKGIKKYKENARTRFLDEEEFRRLENALREEALYNPYAAAAIQLLIFTGARLSEILGMRWSDVKLEDGIVHLPDAKTGPRVILLNGQAREILRSLPRQKGNRYVICGAKPGAHLVNLQKPWRRVRKRAGLEDVRLHDLRHSFASVAAKQGGSLSYIGALLGHTQHQTTQRYAHLIAKDLRDFNEKIGREIKEAMGA